MDPQPLYRCPCCNKLVDAGHFRRVPLTTEDVISLSLHPVMERRILQLVAQALDAGAKPVVREQKPKTAPPGCIPYKQACEEYNITMLTLRSYISKGLITGGGGFVLRSAMDAFRKRYRPRKFADRAASGTP